MRKSKKGFTLIELLVVVAIIGILAAVGIPIFQGFMATAKINATTENHSRIRDMMTANLAKCVYSDSYIKLLASPNNFINATCGKNAQTWAAYFSRHFLNDNAGWQNPYSKGSTFVDNNPSKNPPLGKLHLWHNGNYITITTNVGTEDGKNKYLTASILIE